MSLYLTEPYALDHIEVRAAYAHFAAGLDHALGGFLYGRVADCEIAFGVEEVRLESVRVVAFVNVAENQLAADCL